jgi:TolB-like protein/DNA-binding winged helix-turn-helix (wHTH) protein/Tfp pilus assembly protein PilF
MESKEYRFDGWTLNTQSGELLKDGRRIRLQSQPLFILEELLTHPGRLVTRAELITRLWPKGVVDFDTALNSAVRRLRGALGDHAETPRYIETVPRRGYRFIGTLDPPVAGHTPMLNPGAASLHELPAPGAVQPPVGRAEARSPALGERRPRPYAYMAMALGAAMLLIAMMAIFGLRREPVPAIERYESPTPRADPGARTLAVLPLRTSASDEASILLAHSVTNLIRTRLATLEHLTVIASSSTSGLNDSAADVRSVGEKLHVRYLLKGGADRSGEQLRVDVQLVDAQSDKQLWATAFDRPLTEIVAIREEIFRHVADVLRIPADPATSNIPGSAGINLDAYQVYTRGQQLLANSTATDAEQAIELFRRATILDPGFARAYLGLGQALLLERDLRGVRTPEGQARAAKAFDRALELNPALGEAWIEHARLARDPDKAEEFYRNGLELAPNYGAGYVHYANFLFGDSRAGEAIDTIARARRIDPLTPELHLVHAFFLMVVSSDVAAHDRLVREALEINPDLRSALQQLAYSLWEYSGEFADAAQHIERAIAVDSRWLPARTLARDIYLDLGDPAAATAVLGDSAPPAATVEIAQFHGNRRHAAALLEDIRPEVWEDRGPQASMAQAIRDGAIVTGDFESAVRLLEAVHANREGGLPMWHRAFSLVYAHTLVLAGKVERGRRLAESTLALLETHAVGRAEHWLSRERAAAFAVLGEDERVLEELAHSISNKQLYRWWYLAERDSLYEHLWDDPRFQALDKQARQHLDRQRALLEDLRRGGAVPRRSL